jgi:secreted trypsin-like serine protease
MKTGVVLLTVLALTSALPKSTEFNFRNLYKPPAGKIKTKTNPRIIGGQEATPHSIPYQAFLEIYSESQMWYCGGTLVSQNYILTAGHCGVDAVKLDVILGAHKALQPEDTQLVLTSTEVKVHEEYDGDNIFNDIALVKLPRTISFTSALQPSVLPSYSDINNTYSEVRANVSGWGLTDMYETKPSEVLHYLEMRVTTNKECDDNFNATIIPSMICTSGEDDTGSCSGDSGGPLVTDGVPIGIVSFGVIFCMPGYPSGFTRITSFLDWIAANSDVKIM